MHVGASADYEWKITKIGGWGKQRGIRIKGKLLIIEPFLFVMMYVELEIFKAAFGMGNPHYPLASRFLGM